MSKLTVLIVDDDVKVVEFAKAALKKTGFDYTTRVAFDGKEALGIIENEQIDLGLLDIQMPVMSGAQLLTELCNRKIWFPIIIITGYSVNEIKHNLLDYGIIELLVKPLDINNLKEKIEAVLEKRKLKDSIYGLSPSTIMQVLEMEQRTGIMTLKAKNKSGKIFFRSGKVVDIEVEGASGEEALVGFLDDSVENREISIEYLAHHRKGKMFISFTQLSINVSRFIDEKKR